MIFARSIRRAGWDVGFTRWPISASPSLAKSSIADSITSACPFPASNMPVVLGGESFVALAEGLQNALRALAD